MASHHARLSLNLSTIWFVAWEPQTGATRQWRSRAETAARCQGVIKGMTAGSGAGGSGLIRGRKVGVALRGLGARGAGRIGLERRRQAITHPVGLLPVVDQDAFLEQEV